MHRREASPTILRSSDMTTAVVLIYGGPAVESEYRIVRITVDVCTSSNTNAMCRKAKKKIPHRNPGRSIAKVR
jgi:hypothetical protein